MKKILLFAFLINCLVSPQFFSIAYGFAEEDLAKLLNTGQCNKCDLQGADLSKLNLNRASLTKANLRGADLQRTKLKLADLAGADLTDANLQGADLGGADLYNAVLKGANTEGTSFDGAYLVGTILEKAKPEAVASLPKEPAKMIKAPQASREEESVALDSEKQVEEDLQLGTQHTAAADQDIAEAEQPPPAVQEITQEPAPSITAQQTDQSVPVQTALPVPEVPETAEEILAKNLERLRRTKRCVECNLAGADLAKENLEEAYLERADLAGANLRKADLEKANLKAANLAGADLSDADLEQADLYKANLTGANLSGADLEGAFLDGADLTGAILEGADMEGVTK